VLVECYLRCIDFRTTRAETLLFELDESLCLGLVPGGVMLRVGLPDRQEVVSIKDYASLLHNAVRALRARLVYIPDHFLINSIFDSFISGGPFSSTESSIAVFVKKLR